MREKIKIKYKKPLLWPVFKLIFPAVEWEKHTVVIGDTIYTCKTMPDYREVHERVHLRQCHYSKLFYFFWVMPRYILSKKCRFEYEIEAVREQYRFIRERYGEETASANLDKIAKALSGPVYNHMVSFEEAKKQITNYK